MPEELIASTIIFRDHQHGTWFVQSLVEVFMTHAHDTELVCLPLLTVCLLRSTLQNIQVDLLRMTSERLSHFTNEQGEKQTCNVEMRSDQDVSVFTSCLPTTSTRPRCPCFLPLASQAPVQEDLLQPWAWRRTTGSRSDHERAEYGAVRISWKSSYSDDQAELNLMN